jgi:diacylglycerol O-acyltransferase / wax synthase
VCPLVAHDRYCRRLTLSEYARRPLLLDLATITGYGPDDARAQNILVRAAMTMDRMSSIDASFLHLENDSTQMHIGSVMIFEGPPPPYKAVLALIESRLPLVPRYRQKVRFVPFGLGRPVWIDDPHFNLGYHVRHTALPPPGGQEQVRKLAGRVMSQQLDRTKPLWETWLIEGLGEGRWALLSKVHHCMVDGVSGTDLGSVLFDDERSPASGIARCWTPTPEPSRMQLVASSLALRALDPRAPLHTLARVVATPGESLRRTGEVLRAGGAFVRSLGLARSSLTGPVGSHRRWSWARARLTDVKVVRSELGGTVNDVGLTVIANGFRELLESRGEPVEGRTVRTMVPVSVRKAGDEGTYNNQVSAMFAELPIGLAAPLDRLRAVRTQMDGLKESKQAVAGEVLTSLSGFAPPLLLALGARLVPRSAQFALETATTNVPGPQRPVFTLERRMLEVFPYVPVAAPVRTAVAIFSYDGALSFGVTGDWDAAPDLDRLCAGIERGMAELVALAEGRPAPPSQKRRAATKRRLSSESPA